ncbi:FG-GAP-like repeat-containing protein [Bradyrhizobium sp. HKCCYLS1011]|uniref:FG-GAP-like repeat-containing protein n=1 Tax=Bradyrhizobium sp. HKCCYLS1011 TaxID=3420733 RepID=UPI003EB83044
MFLAGWAACFLAANTTLGNAGSMSLPGQVSVNPSGASTYSIPIAIPPGAAGVAPSLSLDYSSQGPNGLLGIGWSLGGLPSIGRCPRTPAQDGVLGAVSYDANDRFCMDGERLIAISGTYGADGTEYRTEVDSYSKIISHGTAGTGPRWFEVRSKSGQVMEFGHTTDSLVLAQGKTTARSWAVNKVSDTKSNYFTVTYVNDAVNGQAYPGRVDYTGNAAANVAAYNSVQFVYASRPDVVQGYQGGSIVRTTVRLTNVKTFAASSLVADYRIAYQQSDSTQRSEVASVAVCAADGACLPATSFGWQSGAGSGTFTGLTQTLPNDWKFRADAKYIPITGDFNGDGRTDYLLIDSSGYPYQYVFLNNGDGTFTGQTQTLPNGWNFPINSNTPNVNTPIVGDFNGDGKTDYLLIDANGYPYQYVFMSNGNGTFTGLTQTLPNGWKFSANLRYTPIVGDFNGDGRTDYLMVDGNGYPYQYVFMGNGDGTFTGITETLPNGWNFPNNSNTPNMNAPVTGDFNGDGKTDYVLIDSNGYPYQYVFISNGDGTFTGQTQTLPNGWKFTINKNTPNANMPIVGDFNGDNRVDYLLIDANGYPYQYVFINNGDGTFSGQTQTLPNGWIFKANQPYLPIPGDFNGDGKTDYVVIDCGGYPYQYLFMNNGDGTFSGQVQNLPNGWNFPINANTPNVNFPIVGDFNGDGKMDYLLVDANGYPYQYVFMGNGLIGDLIVTANTGLGTTTSISYLPLTNANVYSRDNSASYPVFDLQIPFYVVSRMDTSNGVGGIYSSSYSYAGAKADLSGRGMLGFRQMTVKDLQTGLSDTTTFRQDFPYIGLVASTTRSNGNQVLGQSTNTYQFANASGTTAISPSSAPYRVSLAQNVSSGTDLDGSALPTVTTSNQYDVYGNATQVTVSTPDGYSKTTVNTYSNDPALWYLGRLTRASVTSIAP